MQMLWKAFLYGAAASLAVAFAQKAVSIFLETGEAEVSADSSTSTDLAEEEIVEPDLDEDQQATESLESESGDETETGAENEPKGPDQSPATQAEDLDTSGGAPESEELDEDSAGQLADVISDTIEDEE